MDQFGRFPASGYSLPQKPSTWQSLPILFRATVLGVVASKRNHLPFISGNVTLSPKVWCASYSAKRGMNPKKFFFAILFLVLVIIFIGPESEHWQCLSLTDWLTNWLTHSCLVELMVVNDTNCLMMSQQLLKAVYSLERMLYSWQLPKVLSESDGEHFWIKTSGVSTRY